MQDNQYPYQPSPSLGQMFFVAFVQAAMTELAKRAAIEVIREWVEPPQRKRRYRRRQM
jgi:hypothetical protein